MQNNTKKIKDGVLGVVVKSETIWVSWTPQGRTKETDVNGDVLRQESNWLSVLLGFWWQHCREMNCLFFTQRKKTT